MDLQRHVDFLAATPITARNYFLKPVPLVMEQTDAVPFLGRPTLQRKAEFYLNLTPRSQIT